MTKVGEIAKKVRGRKLKWYGHVMRREEHCVGRRAMVMKVQGRRKRGRPKRRWLDRVRDDIKEKGLLGGRRSVRPCYMKAYRCHGLRVYPVCVCNTVRLGQDTT